MWCQIEYHSRTLSYRATCSTLFHKYHTRTTSRRFSIVWTSSQLIDFYADDKQAYFNIPVSDVSPSRYSLQPLYQRHQLVVFSRRRPKQSLFWFSLRQIFNKLGESDWPDSSNWHCSTWFTVKNNTHYMPRLWQRWQIRWQIVPQLHHTIHGKMGNEKMGNGNLGNHLEKMGNGK